MKTTALTNEKTLSSLYRELVLPIFNRVAATDARRPNTIHSALDALKSGFAIFNLKSPSLFAFQPKTDNQKENLKSVYEIENIPSDNGLRNILDQLDANELNRGFDTVLPYLESISRLKDYRYWNGHLIVSIDGVQHQCSKKVKCDLCLTRKNRDGTVSHSHSMLSAALVCPRRREVFVLNNETILRQDGEKKNDCERNSAKRLFDRMSKTMSDESVVYVLDALYACAPVVKQISAGGPNWKYVINAKEKGCKYLFEQFDELNDSSKVKWKTKIRKSGTYHFGYLNEVSINKSNENIKCNFLYCRFKPPGGKEIVFSWITNIPLTDSNLVTVMEMGRSRWKIENEVFNTLKNQEYNYEHNFGHGSQHLASNFAYLMMLAFTVDQFQLLCSKRFKALHDVMKTRIGIWEMYRGVFLTTLCESLEDFERKLLILCGVRVT
jgi:hypothetical protein